MKVLITGANGFVGSHILDRLRERRIPCVLVLRQGSSRHWIARHLPEVDVHTCGLDKVADLVEALAEVTHVVHCAGSTNARSQQGFLQANQATTARLVEAVNCHSDRIRRFIHISSLAATGPSKGGIPALEDGIPHPVSYYGQSKLAGEQEVIRHCKTDFVIFRPAAVYGPRDREFLRLFQAVRNHIRPVFGGGRQPLSLVYVADLVAVIEASLEKPEASRCVVHVAHPQTITAGGLAMEFARAANTWTIPLPLPICALWPVCLLQEFAGRFTAKPGVLNRQKYAELSAEGWVCSTDKLKLGLGLSCSTPLKAGLAETVRWYEEQGWL